MASTTERPAKYLAGTTLGNFPQMYPYVLQHINEAPVEVKLREQAMASEEAIMLGAPDEAAFFRWLLPTIGAKKAIEVGTFRGTTTLALALSLPEDGKVVALDVSEEWAQLGVAAWKEANVAHKVDFRVGPATDSMTKLLLEENAAETFDFVFIDADKVNYDSYYELALRLLKRNGVIAVDNCLWGGQVLAPQSDCSKAIVTLNEKIRCDKRVHATMIPIADGVYLVRKL